MFNTKRILALAIPSIATFSSMTLTGMISLVIVGHLGALAIAVVGVCNIIMYSVWAFFTGIGNTVNFLVSQNFGANDMDKANQRTQIALRISLILCLLLAVAALAAPHAILTLMGASPALIKAGVPYLRIRLFSFCSSLFTLVFMAYMRGVGNTKIPMYISIISSALLVVLTYGLTYGRLGFPQLGLQGAALAMVFSEVVGLALCIYVYLGPFARQFNTRALHSISWPETKLIVLESAKLGGMETSMSLSMFIFTMCITSLGTVALASNEIALNILSFGFMPANGFGATATILVGQEIGRNQPGKGRRLGHETSGIGVLFMALFSVVLILWREPIASLYTSDVHVSIPALSLIQVAAFVQIFDGANIIYGGGLRGAGDTTFLFRVSLLASWFVFVPLTYLLTIHWHLGTRGAWFGLCTLIVILGVANMWRFQTLTWSSLIARTAEHSKA